MILNQFLKLVGWLTIAIILFASCTKRLDATFMAENDQQSYLTLKSDGTFQGQMTINAVTGGQKSPSIEIIPLKGKYKIHQNTLRLIPEMVMEKTDTQSRALNSQPFEMIIQNDSLKTVTGIRFVKKEKEA